MAWDRCCVQGLGFKVWTFFFPLIVPGESCQCHRLFHLLALDRPSLPSTVFLQSDALNSEHPAQLGL